MQRIVIASGDSYTEIDSLASALAYSELLKLEGNKKTQVILPGAENKSITADVKKWDLDYSKALSRVRSNDLFVVVDISEPAHLASFVDQKRIIELYDHHFGSENYWKETLGRRAKIEKVGACATLIWEEYEKRGLSKKISKTSANLISTAILSNTLNFKASVTDSRDIAAYKKLFQYVDLPRDWVRKYFTDQERAAKENPEKVIREDTIIIRYNLPFDLVIGQLELWNGRGFIEKHVDDIENAFKTFGKRLWFLTLPSIEEGKNYLFTKQQKVKDILRSIVNAKFEGNIGTTGNLWLRKEMRKKLQEIDLKLLN